MEWVLGGLGCKIVTGGVNYTPQSNASALTFRCCIDLVFIVISRMKIFDVANGQNKKLVSIDVAIN